ncbi:glycoside hydrolase family 65 protein [Hoyosella sp. YIM 151337]|uniref:glycoside hydrolase family 65 protein n=1 Tax=Hoyosella sp. YIM 151337 TaxID=2992742 RepID=UPI002235B582|nr:glycosyl hydrolase family 65 protein [Hoyosella sp. YIM 151337]MCW4352939.1 glycoside hydrolase family 65 protein [Hoyosella sp. YIM 151337]
MVDTWHLEFDGYDASAEKLREALCTVGNGYLATRGAAPEMPAGQSHYPGTYIAGLFNRLDDTVGGVAVTNESLVNVPNWLPVEVRAEGDDEWFSPETHAVHGYKQTLNIRHAVLTRTFTFTDRAGRDTHVTQQRFASMHHPHVAALKTTARPLNWTGQLELRSCVDGDVANDLVERYRDLSRRHLEPAETRSLGREFALLETRTTSSHIRIAVAMRNHVVADAHPTECELELVHDRNRIGHSAVAPASPDHPVTLTKTVAICTSRDPARGAPGGDAGRIIVRADTYEALLADHVTAWEALWLKWDCSLSGHDVAERTVRFHLMHVLQTLSPHTQELDAGVPARGLHGEAYRGHIFWDELFVLPGLSLRMPALARALIKYRYRRLPEARAAAHARGYIGAMFPWQSGGSGGEESQSLHLNPRSGRWLPDASHRAHHVGLAIAYTVWQYYQVTADVEFLTDYGAEMLLDVARFWGSFAQYDPADSRYHIRGVIGPDEFHAGYPEAPHEGVDDNAYTNVLAAWTIQRALAALRIVNSRARAELERRLGLCDTELAHLEEVSRRLYVPFHDGGIISQFAGYEKLAELPWEAYRSRYGNIQRLDRILEAEADDITRYQASKQADVLMLLYLFSVPELTALLESLGYHLARENVPRMIDYYLARTSHGSTLSSVVHAWVLARAHRREADELYEHVLKADLSDIQGGTTSEGIHLAAMAGSIDIVQRCYSGLEFRDERVIFAPCFPDSFGDVSFGFRYRGGWFTVSARGTSLTISAAAGAYPRVTVECHDRVVTLSPGEKASFEPAFARLA